MCVHAWRRGGERRVMKLLKIKKKHSKLKWVFSCPFEVCFRVIYLVFSRVDKLLVALHCTGKNLALSKPTSDKVRHTHVCIHRYVSNTTGVAGAGFVPNICPTKNIAIDWHCMHQDWRITNLHICPAWVLWSVPVYVDIVINMRSHDLVASFQYCKCKGLGMRLQSFVYWRRDEGSLGMWLVAHIVCKVCNAMRKSFRVSLQSPRWIPLTSHPTVLNNNT